MNDIAYHANRGGSLGGHDGTALANKADCWDVLVPYMQARNEQQAQLLHGKVRFNTTVTD